MYEVVLTFRPTRTRKYTRTTLDLVNDMFVPRTELAFVSYGYEAAQDAGQRLMEELRDDCPNVSEPPYALTPEWRAWRTYLASAWNEAIHTREMALYGITESDPLPQRVFTILREEEYRPWGKNDDQSLFVYEPESVHAHRASLEPALARLRGARTGDYVFREHELLVPAPAAA